MALVPRRRQRQLAIGAVLANAAVRALRNPGMQGQLLRDVVFDNGNSQQASNPGGPAKQHKRKSAKPQPTERRGNEWSASTGVVFNRSVGAPPIKVSFNYVVAFTTNASGAVGYLARMALGDPASIPNLSTNSTRMANLATMYRKWNLLKLKVSWVPSVADSAAGMCCIGIDGDTMRGAVAGIADCSRFGIAALTGVRTGTTVSWKPKTHVDRESKRCQTAVQGTVDRTNDELGYGTINVYIDGAAASTLQGYLLIEGDAAFFDPIA